MASPNDPKHIIVLGAGVIGLTTALKIQQKGPYKVTIVANQFPTDAKGIRYTSLSAGAHHVNIAGSDPVQRAIDLETFETMWGLSELDREAQQCFLRLPQYEFYRDESNCDTLKLMPGFSELPEDSLTPNSIAGITYNTVNTDAPVFLNHLLSKFLASGGSIVKATVNHIDQVIEGGAFTDNDETTKTVPSAIINCLGLGARVLGVEDHNVYPVRGQTVLIRAPWIQRMGNVCKQAQILWLDGKSENKCPECQCEVDRRPVFE